MYVIIARKVVPEPVNRKVGSPNGAVLAAQHVPNLETICRPYTANATHARLNATFTPFSDAQVSVIASFSGSGSRLSSSLNSCRIRTRTYPDSVRAYCWPRQIRGPPLKGIYSCSFALDISNTHSLGAGKAREENEKNIPIRCAASPTSRGGTRARRARRGPCGGACRGRQA